MTMLLTNGNVRYPLKTPYRDGTTHVIFGPLDKIAGWPEGRRAGCPEYFIARLVALIPKPRVNLTRLDGGHPCPPPFGQPSVVQIYSR